MPTLEGNRKTGEEKVSPEIKRYIDGLGRKPSDFDDEESDETDPDDLTDNDVSFGVDADQINQEAQSDRPANKDAYRRYREKVEAEQKAAEGGERGETPGGRAIEAPKYDKTADGSAPLNRLDRTPDVPQTSPFSKASQAKKTVEASQKAEQLMSQAIRQAVKAASRAVASWLASAAAVVGWPVLVAILILVPITIFGAFWANSWYQAHKSPNPMGGALLEPPNPLGDKDALLEFLILAGDIGAKKTISAEIINNIQKQLDAAVNELQSDSNSNFSRRQEMVDELVAIKSELPKLNSTDSKTAESVATSIATRLGNLLSYFSAKIEPAPGQYGKLKDKYLPIDISKNQMTFGHSLHYRTLWYPAAPPADALTHRTFMFFELDRGDALDITKMPAQTKLYAAVNGTLTKDSSISYKLTSTDGKYEIIYAETNITKTGTVRAGEEIGSGSSVHLEVKVNGLPVNYQPQDIKTCGGLKDIKITIKGVLADSKGCPSPTKNLGSYYWDYIVKLFGPS